MVLSQQTIQSNQVNIHHFHVHYSFMLKTNAVAENEATYDFIKFTIENAGEMAEAVGYVSLPEDKYTAGLSTLEGLK